jgi:hypothetical protein
MKKTLIISIILILAVGAGSFFGGMKYGQSKSGMGFKNGNFKGALTGMPGTGTRQNSGSPFVLGEIISKDDTSMTIKTSNGGSKIVFYSGSTSIQKTATGTAADLETGKSVTVIGTTNSDGSITAQTIQFGQMPGGQMPGQAVPVQ